MSHMLPNAWKETSTAALAGNIGLIRARLKPETALMAVVKTNAYGHGMEPVAREAARCGVRWFGVSNVAEGARLRAELRSRPRILILECVPPDHIPELLAHALTPVACQPEFLVRYNRLAARAGAPAPYHLVVDTGMGRIGVRPDEIDGFRAATRGLRRLVLEGVTSHFACADTPENPANVIQDTRFRAALGRLETLFSGRRIIRHMANSAAIFSRPASHWDMVRAGISLYGVCPFPRVTPQTRGLVPVLSVRSRVSLIRSVPPHTPLSYGHTYRTPSRRLIATVSIGYGHGFSRRLTNRGVRVLIRDRAFPVVGTVTMSQVLVDLGLCRAVRTGDVVTVLGRDTTRAVDVREVARLQGTISYEVLCGYSELPLLPRV